jgi:hypothetical protein
VLRDVTISFLDQQGDDFRTLNFLESFIAQYTFPELDRREGDTLMVEGVTIQPGYSNDFWELN